MYSIYANDLLIYSDVTPAEEVKVLSPKLSLQDSAAGSLTMSLPPCNVGYSENIVKRLVTDIIVKCDNEEIWRGRIIQEEYDFWKNRKLTCEGELAFLIDTIQPPHKYDSSSTTIFSFLKSLLTIHNANVTDDRKFEIGEVTVNDGDQLEDDDSIYRYTNYETTLQCINEKLLDRLGGHLRVRHITRNGKDVRLLDYIDDDTIGVNPQIIRFGQNLTDFIKSYDVTEFSTVVIPRGDRLDDDEVTSDDGPVDGLETYLTVKRLGAKYETINGVRQLWHANKSLYVENPTAISAYGRIETVIDFQNVTVADNLYTKAVKYLKDEQFDNMILEIKAIDLHYLTNSETRIKMLDKLRCISEPHGMDHMFPITKMDISLDKPDDSVYTLGTDVQLSLTQANAKINSGMAAKIEEIPSKSNILKDAQENAFKILTGQNGGYVRFIKNDNDVITDIVISDGVDDEHSVRKWVFNTGGLGHVIKDTQPYTGSQRYKNEWLTTNVAMTMNGAIVADRITSGALFADRIKGGSLVIGDVQYGNEWRTGSITVTNRDASSGNTSTKVKIDRTGIAIYGGSIDINAKDSKGNIVTRFKATSAGVVTILGGSINIHNSDGSQTFKVTESGEVTIKGGSYYQKNGSDIVSIENGRITTQGTWIRLMKNMSVETQGELALGAEHSAYQRNNDPWWGKNYQHTLESSACLIEAARQIEEGHSDIRVKEKIKDLDKRYSKELIRRTHTVSFYYKVDNEKEDDSMKYGKRYGVIAQEVRALLNELGNADDAYLEHHNGNAYANVEYKDYIAHLINCIQDLYQEVELLKEEKQNG